MTAQPEAAAAKAALRKAMLARRAELSVEQRLHAALRLAELAVQVTSGAAVKTISGFCAFRDEIDPMPLLEALHKAGLLLVLPRVAGAHLTFHRWAPGDVLVPGKYGIPEPLPDTPQAMPDVMLIPLVAFDRRGNRLGYGAGFFDRVLADYRPRAAIGLAYAMQEASALPVEPHDRPLDAILTEQGLIDCRRD